MKLIMIIVVFVLSTTFLFGSEIKDGYYVNSKGTKVNCSFNFKVGLLSSKPDFFKERFQVEVIINEKHIIIAPDSVKYFVFNDNGVDRKFVSVHNDIEEGGILSDPKPNIFMEQVIEGFANLFIGRYIRGSFSGGGVNGQMTYSSNEITDYFVKKGYNSLEIIPKNKKDFRENLGKILEDNPMLVYEIKQSKFSEEYLYSVIKQYNDWHNNGSIVPIDTNIYSIVETSPKYDNEDINEVKKYIREKIDWPKDEKISKIAIQGIIETNGKLKDIKLNGFKNHPELNSQIIDNVKRMNKWQPGKIKEMKVRTMIVLLIEK